MAIPQKNIAKDTQKILYDFDTQTSHVIQAMRRDVSLSIRKNRYIMDFDVPANHRV